jgi:hypothetical protein
MPMTTENTQSSQPPRASRSGPWAVGHGHGASGTSGAPVQIGYKPHHPTPPNVDQHQPASFQATRRPTGEALVRVLSAALHQANAAQPDHTMPSPGGQASGIARHKNRCGWDWVGRVWHPAGLPKGYHTTAQGQSYTMHAPVPSRAAPEPPRGRVAPGRRDVTRAQRARSSVDPTVSLEAWPRKHLTTNQVLGSGHTAVRARGSRSPLPTSTVRTTMNVLGPGPEDKA